MIRYIETHLVIISVTVYINYYKFELVIIKVHDQFRLKSTVVTPSMSSNYLV